MLYWTQPNLTHQKLTNLDPTRPNPTDGSTQPMDNSAIGQTVAECAQQTRKICGRIDSYRSLETASRRDRWLLPAPRATPRHFRHLRNYLQCGSLTQFCRIQRRQTVCRCAVSLGLGVGPNSDSFQDSDSDPDWESGIAAEPTTDNRPAIGSDHRRKRSSVNRSLETA